MYRYNGLMQVVYECEHIRESNKELKYELAC